MKKLNYLLALTLSGMMLISCGGDKKKDNVTTTPETQTETPAKEEEQGVKITISGDDQMKFDKSEIRVPVGKKITLTLKHSGKMEKTVMGHNWVLLAQGTDMTVFATEAAQATDTDYIPENGKENIIVHTKLLGGGESDTIEFTITEAGTYDYLCTFPAHFALMQGKLIAE